MITDVVRCSVVLESAESILELVLVGRGFTIAHQFFSQLLLRQLTICFFELTFMSVLQKLVANSWIGEIQPSGLNHWLLSKWDAFLVRGLGLIPLEEKRSDSVPTHGAFELLRVRMFEFTFLADFRLRLPSCY
jgi:hypothetical protein